MEEEYKYFDFYKEPGKILYNTNPINDKSKPLISILTPYYNAKKYIEQTANSIFNQTIPYWEWIIIDDGSTENGTKEFLDELSKKDNRIKILRKSNSGCSASRYYGAKFAQAEIIYLLDADDLIDETLLECGYWALKNNPGATWAYSNIVGFGAFQYLWKKFFKVSLEKKENLLVVSAFIRKDALLEFEEYENLEKDIYEDWYLWMNFLKKGYYPVRMDFYGFWYRRLKKSMLSDIKGNKEYHKKAMSKIKTVAKDVDNNLAAIQFPDLEYDDVSQETEMLKWNKDLMYLKKKINILFIFSNILDNLMNKINLNIIKGLNKEEYQITIITTIPSGYILRQQFENYATVFDLSTFLHKKEWADFICYLIKSRNIELIINCYSKYGYNILPLIRYNFPNISVVDFLYDKNLFFEDNEKYLNESIVASKLLKKTYIFSNSYNEILLKEIEQKNKKADIIFIETEFIQLLETEFKKLTLKPNEIISKSFQSYDLAKNYLDKRCILDNDANKYDFSKYYSKQVLRDTLWKISMWRFFIKLFKKFSFVKIAKIFKKKESSDINEKV